MLYVNNMWVLLKVGRRQGQILYVVSEPHDQAHKASAGPMAKRQGVGLVNRRSGVQISLGPNLFCCCQQHSYHLVMPALGVVFWVVAMPAIQVV